MIFIIYSAEKWLLVRRVVFFSFSNHFASIKKTALYCCRYKGSGISIVLAEKVLICYTTYIKIVWQCWSDFEKILEKCSLIRMHPWNEPQEETFILDKKVIFVKVFALKKKIIYLL